MFRDLFVKYKKILIAIIFIFFVVAIGYLLYLLFFKPGPPPGSGERQQPAGEATGVLPLAQTGAGQINQPKTAQYGLAPASESAANRPSLTAKGGLTQTTELNRDSSLGAALSKEGNEIFYYNQRDGKFYRLSKNGDLSPLSDVVFHDARKITWSPDKDKAILEYPDQAKIIYDFQNKKQISLPRHWQDFDFSPDGARIVLKSLGQSADNRWLAVINDQGTDAKKIAALGDNGDAVYPSWSPNNQTVAMYTEGVGFDRQRVFFVGLNEENFKSLLIEGRGFKPIWSPRGDRLLYNVYASDNGLKPELWETNAQGENIGSGRVKLNVQTWADKCAFSSNTEVYCAVPERLEDGAGLFPELAKATKDNLYKIDLLTGLKKLIAIPAVQATMSNLIISANGSDLYFTDENTGRINRIRLK